jgi:hypothetical protein
VLTVIPALHHDFLFSYFDLHTIGHYLILIWTHYLVLYSTDSFLSVGFSSLFSRRTFLVDIHVAPACNEMKDHIHGTFGVKGTASVNGSGNGLGRYQENILS